MRVAFNILAGAAAVGLIVILVALADRLSGKPRAGDARQWAERRVSLEVHGVTVRELLERLCEVEGCRVDVRGDGVLLVPAAVRSEP